MTRQSDDRTTDRWVTVLEAAELLGLTPDAVRARLRRGTLRKERGEDGTLYVVLDSDSTANGRPTEQPTVVLLDAKDQTIAHLSEQLAFLRDQLREEREESRRKDHLLAAALERIPEIEAPSEPSDSPVNAPGGDGGIGEGPSDQERPSWWRRFFGVK